MGTCMQDDLYYCCNNNLFIEGKVIQVNKYLEAKELFLAQPGKNPIEGRAYGYAGLQIIGHLAWMRDLYILSLCGQWGCRVSLSLKELKQIPQTNYAMKYYFICYVSVWLRFRCLRFE